MQFIPLEWGGSPADTCSLVYWNPVPNQAALMFSMFAPFLCVTPAVASAPIPASVRPAAAHTFTALLVDSADVVHNCSVIIDPSGVVTFAPDTIPFTIKRGSWGTVYSI